MHKRKIISLFLAAALTVSTLSGCGLIKNLLPHQPAETSAVETETKKESSKETDYNEFTLEGVTMSLPFTLEEYEDLFEWLEEDLDYDMMMPAKSYSTFYATDSILSIANSTKSPMALSECDVKELTLFRRCADIEYQGISWDSSEDDIKEILGEPSSYTDTGYIIFVNYYFDRMGVSFTFVDESLESIQVSKPDFSGLDYLLPEEITESTKPEETTEAPETETTAPEETEEPTTVESAHIEDRDSGVGIIIPDGFDAEEETDDGGQSHILHLSGMYGAAYYALSYTPLYRLYTTVDSEVLQGLVDQHIGTARENFTEIYSEEPVNSLPFENGGAAGVLIKGADGDVTFDELIVFFVTKNGTIALIHSLSSSYINSDVGYELRPLEWFYALE